MQGVQKTCVFNTSGKELNDIVRCAGVNHLKPLQCMVHGGELHIGDGQGMGSNDTEEDSGCIQQRWLSGIGTSHSR
jgi:hypothetical protein